MHKIAHIVFEESFLLGWKTNRQAVIFYADLLLTSKHTQWAPPVRCDDFGCYKIGILTFEDVTRLKGLASVDHPPHWNSKLAEFDSYSEFDSVKIDEETAVFELEHETIDIKFGKFKICLLTEGTFRFALQNGQFP